MESYNTSLFKDLVRKFFLDEKDLPSFRKIGSEFTSIAGACAATAALPALTAMALCSIWFGAIGAMLITVGAFDKSYRNGISE